MLFVQLHCAFSSIVTVSAIQKVTQIGFWNSVQMLYVLFVQQVHLGLLHLPF